VQQEKLLTVSVLIMLSISACQCFPSSSGAGYTKAKYDVNSNINSALFIVDNNILGNLAKQFDGLTKRFEYTVDLDGNQIFSNDTIKQDIVKNYKSSDYNINSLNYILLGFDIDASDVKIHVNPLKIDATKTKVDFPVVFARNVTVTNGSINLKYGKVNLGGIYGVYDEGTDKITMHIPINVALRYLPR
jgi:hypothetical protein